MPGAVVVLGAAGGLGGAVLTALLEAGGGPGWITYRSDSDAAERLVKDRPDATAWQCDVTDEDDLGALATAVGAGFAEVAVLVHCAVDAVKGPLSELGPERLGAALAVSATSLVGVTNAFGELLGPGSSVIYLTSIGSQRVVRDYGAVGVAKAAGEAIVRYLAAELGPRGVRVNAVSAGPVGTKALGTMTDDVDALLASSARRAPMGRNISPAEVGDVIVNLASMGSSAVTGQVITVDAGLFLA